MSADVLRPLTREEAQELRGKRIAEGVAEVLISLEQLQDPKILQLERKTCCRHITSAINICQWTPPTEKRDFYDYYYLENYAAWKEWLLKMAGRNVAFSDHLSLFELRTALVAFGTSLLLHWERTAYEELRHHLYRQLCIKCYVPETIIDHIIDNDCGAQDEAKSILSSELGLGFMTRDRGGAAEEKAGVIQFKCVTNDRTPGSTMQLVTLRSIFSRQLPHMPREYITRLVFDRQHYSFCLIKNGRVVGGCCFRPFFQSRFCEVVFLAITSTEQVKGYGTRLMNHLKEYLRHRSMEYFLTYADNFALGYFRKQGFSPTITMPRERWVGFIKDYDKSTLMECIIHPNINYLTLGDQFQKQRKIVYSCMRLCRVPKIYSGSHLWANYRPYTDQEFTTLYPPQKTFGGSEDQSKSGEHLPMRIDPKTIPGFLEAGYVNSEATIKKDLLSLNDQILKFLDNMSKHEAAWPFVRPVSKAEAPDYYLHIKHPMDISLMKKNAKNKAYKTKDEFGAHLKLMFENCRYYNHKSSIYHKLADDLENAMNLAFEDLIDD